MYRENGPDPKTTRVEDEAGAGAGAADGADAGAVAAGAAAGAAEGAAEPGWRGEGSSKEKGP